MTHTNVLITRNLPPLVGGMERLNVHLARALSAMGDLVVVGPEGCAPFLPHSAMVVEIPVRPLWRFLAQCGWQMRNMAVKNPGVVVAGSGLTAPFAVQLARRLGARSAAYVHGLDLVARHPVYRGLWLPKLRQLDFALANSRNTQSLAAGLAVANGRVQVVHPGTVIPPEDAGRESRTQAFREQHGLGNRPLLLSVGRLTPRKGLGDFVEYVLPEVLAQVPDAMLLHIGDKAPNALRGNTRDPVRAILAKAERLGIQQAIRFLGATDDPTLHCAYEAAQVHVFPVQSVPGDVEGFGMVCIEAAARGLRTVAFDVGGVADAVRDGESGYLVEPGNFAVFQDQTLTVIADGSRCGECRKFAEQFDWSAFEARMLGLLEKLCAPAASGRESVLE